MSSPQVAAIVLAAGKGTRMKSDLPKVMHRIAGRTMIRHVLNAVAPLAPARIVVVLAPGMETVAKEAVGASIAIQAQPLGTGHAAQAALPALQDLLDAGALEDVLVLFGDTPLLTAPTLAALVAERRRPPAAAAVVLGMRPADPAAYGRLICDENGMLEAIVEAKDATAAQRAIALCKRSSGSNIAAMIPPASHAGRRPARRAAAPRASSQSRARLEASRSGTIGIGHTRWATHGKPTESNAHPHATDRVAVVHNGIIENFRELRDELRKRGRKFETETDTEVVAHLVDRDEMKGARRRRRSKARCRGCAAPSRSPSCSPARTTC
jgi:CTP:molybdopterin cytidylyltransferase MocA